MRLKHASSRILGKSLLLRPELERHVRAVLAGQEDGRDLTDVLSDIRSAYELRDAVADALGPTCGWKIAANAVDQRNNPALDAPVAGRIVGAPRASGVYLKLSDFKDFMIEPEFAAVLGQDVKGQIDRRQANEVVSSFHVAFELLDRRGLGPLMHLPTFVGYNVFNAGVVLGDEVPRAALQDYVACFVIDGEEKLMARNTAPQDPLDAVVFVLNHATERGFAANPGDVILCGTHYPPTSISEPSSAEFSVEGCLVSLSISA